MTTTEKLQRIKAECERLLALAEKRTPGKWTPFPALPGSRVCPVGTRVLKYGHHPIADTFFDPAQTKPTYQQSTDNATFIASCAGPAESGWRATIAAIDGTRFLLERAESCGHHSAVANAISCQNEILTAWEGLV